MARQDPSELFGSALYGAQRERGEREPAPIGGGALPADAQIRAILAALQGQNIARQTGLASSTTQAGPVTFERSFGPGGGFSSGTRARQITGGFAPGTAGATFQEMLPRILQSLFAPGGGFGGPTRESLIEPRLADLDRAFGQTEQGILNRFAGLGRDVTGSVPTGELAALGARRGLERSRAMGDVDTLLAQLGIQQQGAATQRLQAIMQIMQALGMGGR